MEYISKDDAVGLSYWHGSPCTADNPYPDGTDAVDVSDIKKMQTVDIIFCKDCKYFIDDENDINFGEAVKYWHEFDCSGLCIFDVVDRCGQYRVTDVKDFCSNGEPTQN